ncbi:hypothetical protein Bca101_010013 [Brassica carinata]
MKTGSNPSPSSSSIGSRIRSKKNRVTTDPPESTDSSDLSLDLTAADVLSLDLSQGKETIKKVLKLPAERRQIPYLVSKEALERCSIWGNMSEAKGDEALAKYQKAYEAMYVKKAGSKKPTPVEDDDDVQFVRSNKRKATPCQPPSSSKKRAKVPGSASKESSSLPLALDNVLANLTAKFFPLTPVLLALEKDSSAAIQSLQVDLLQVVTQLYQLGERMEDKTSMKAEMDTLASQLREEKDRVLAQEKEIKGLKLKLKNQDEAGVFAAPENASLREQLEKREEEICELKDAAETFGIEKSMAVNGAQVMARWELMREWLKEETESWNLATALEQYKIVKTTEAQFLGLPAPSFEDEPQIPEKAKVVRTPEPSDDDPQVN